MPPKKGKKDVDDGEEVLQAVLIADNFRKRMSPLTYTTPKCLLPVANVEVIEYTIELLGASGIKELFIVCCSHADKVSAYIEETKNRRSVSFNIYVVDAPSCKSLGAAMRDVDARGKIRGDFFLIHGDVISTIKLSEALEAHKNRREKEKNKDAIMTMVMKASPPQQRSPMFEEDDMAVAINPETGQLVHFQSMRGKAFSVDPAQFEPHTSVAIRYDLDYTYICVCSPEVLCLFTDEFDWLDFHKDFVPGVLTSEILSYQIYTYVATSGYAGRVSCLNSYAAVTHDVLHRWTYPLVPEVNLLSDTSFVYTHKAVYKESQVALAQSCEIGCDCVFGAGTSVADDAVITRSVLGRQCSIGKGVKIFNSILMSGVSVGDGAVIRDSIIGDNVVIGAQCDVGNNCVVGDNSKLSNGQKLEEGTRITVDFPCDSQGDDEDDFSSDEEEGGGGEEDKRVETVEKDVGAGGKGRKWIPAEDECEAARVHMVMAEGALDDDGGDDRDDSDEDSDDGTGGIGLTFEQEVEDIVKRGVEEDVNPDNIAMEVNGRKFAHDRTFGQCAQMIIVSALRTMEPPATRKEAFAASVKLLKKWKPLLVKFARTVADQKDSLVALESFVTDETWAKHKLMMPIAKTLYDEDIVEEQAVLDWAEDANERGGEAKALVKECKTFLDYLEQESDEEDSDDDE